MGVILAFFVGYLVGARGGNEEFEEVVTAVQAVVKSEEFEQLVSALRIHAGHALQDIGQRLGQETGSTVSMDTLLAKARGFVQNVTTESES